MLNKITVVFLALLLQACAISVGERNIIMQDEQVVTLSPADIDTIKQLKSGLEVTATMVPQPTACGLNKRAAKPLLSISAATPCVLKKTITACCQSC